jgi:hypothetical protein
VEREQRVAVVVTPEHVRKIETLAAECPVWAVRTPESEAIAERVWGQGSASLTLFSGSAHPEETLLDVLPEIELHHGEESGFPPLGRVDVFGADPSDGLRREFGLLGLPRLCPQVGGFTASRGSPDGPGSSEFRA